MSEEKNGDTLMTATTKGEEEGDVHTFSAVSLGAPQVCCDVSLHCYDTLQ